MLTRPLLLLMAVTTGLTVGGNYVNQPLLDTIATDLGVSDGRAAALVTVAQVSYGLGLLLVVPLGDLLERRGLLVTLALLAAAGHAVCALAPSYAVLVVGTAVAGVFSVAAQVLVPFAAELAEPGREGRAVGTVMSGLLIGALLARSVSGALAEVGGWHAPYASSRWGCSSSRSCCAAGSRAASRPPPRVPGDARVGGAAGRRTAAVAHARPARRAGFRGRLGPVRDDDVPAGRSPLRPVELQIGLVGLAGVAGASMASLAGRMADAGKGQWATGIGAVGLVATWGLLGLSSSVWLTSLLLFVLGSDWRTCSCRPSTCRTRTWSTRCARTPGPRLNSVYMTTYFAGGALGSAVGSRPGERAGGPSSAPSARVSGSWSCSSGSSTCVGTVGTGAQRCRRR